jgi:aspartyl-tRNA(Asn)/glutamyl-tRNA(Gln) amidotransferase subunit C
MIDRTTVQKIAHLARLEITAAEEESLTAQLGGILDYFEQLSELDTEKTYRPPPERSNLAILLESIETPSTTGARSC